MTAKHFNMMAAMVRAILAGKWTDEAPAWADETRYPLTDSADLDAINYQRAVQTAEAFVILCEQSSNTFQRVRFLRACGLLAEEERKPRKRLTR